MNPYCYILNELNELVFLRLYTKNELNEPQKNRIVSKIVSTMVNWLVFSCPLGKTIFKEWWMLKYVGLKGKRGKWWVRYLVLNH